MKQRKGKLIVLLLALVCSFSAAFGTMIAVNADETSNEIPVTTQCTMNQLSKFTYESNYQGKDLGRIKVKLMYTEGATKFFNKDVEGYNLHDFTAPSGSDDGLLLDGFTVNNFQFNMGPNGGSIVTVVESKIDGSIIWEFASGFGGWIEWPCLYRVYKKTAAGVVTMVKEAYHYTDGAAFKAVIMEGISVDVNVGDVIYYELGADNSRNYQNLNTVTIKAKLAGLSDELTEELRASYVKKIEDKFAALDENKYAADKWELIKGYVNTFKTNAATYKTLSPLMMDYNNTVALMDAVKENNVENVRTELKGLMTNYYNSLVEANYTEADWNTIKAAYKAFTDSIDTLTEEQAIRDLYNTYLDTMKAVKASKQSMGYLDYPSKMNANGYDWIKGDVVDTKLLTGSVENGILPFDTKGATEHIMYNASVNTGSNPIAYAENWKWYVTGTVGVIVAYRANVDCELVITDIREADGKGGNGYTDDTTLTKYIVRNEQLKKIGQINRPKTDSDFSGTYYLKAGDMLYIEYIALSTIDEGQQRNTESPYATSFNADSTAFDQGKYDTQNHDLPKEVTDLIAVKQTALNEWFGSLKEEDYSQINWATLKDELAVFATKAETDVNTVEDVEKLYNEVLTAAQSVQTLAQAAAELKATLDGYASELKAKYDELVANNKYSKENRAVLDAAYKAGVDEINNAKSKAAGNTAKLKAIGAMNAVEVAPAGGCNSNLSSVGLCCFLLAVALVAIVLRKREN